jgi:hypothetical protein
LPPFGCFDKLLVRTQRRLVRRGTDDPKAFSRRKRLFGVEIDYSIAKSLEIPLSGGIAGSHIPDNDSIPRLKFLIQLVVEVRSKSRNLIVIHLNASVNKFNRSKHDQKPSR